MTPSRSEPMPPSAVETLYAKLKEASDNFAVLRQEPYFSTVELGELVALAAQAKDSANWLKAQRDTAEARRVGATPEERGEAPDGENPAAMMDFLLSDNPWVCEEPCGKCDTCQRVKRIQARIGIAVGLPSPSGAAPERSAPPKRDIMLRNTNEAVNKLLQEDGLTPAPERSGEDKERETIIAALEALDPVVPWEQRCHGETLVQRIEYLKGQLRSALSRSSGGAT